MKRFFYLIFLCAFILTGCKKEPMIRLSEERQAALSVVQSTESFSETSSEILSFDKSQFKAYDDTMVFEDISAFVPIQPNQIHVLSEKGVELKQYMDFVDSSEKIMQVREVSDTRCMTTFYAWGTEQIVQLKSEESSILPINRISQIINESSDRLILLQVPLQKGTQWNVADNLTGMITNLYQDIQLNGTIYHDVIEVTYDSKEGQTNYYFAKGLGIVAVTYAQGEKLLIQTQADTQYQEDVSVYVPIVNSNPVQLTTQMTNFSWQTNDLLTQRYTELFQVLGWISSDIQINSIEQKDDLLIVDFTPGVVAAINASEAKEEGVIPAMVATLGKHFNVSQVQLTVNTLGLLPDRLSYPVGGIWIVRDEWLNTQESAETTEMTETTSQTIQE